MAGKGRLFEGGDYFKQFCLRAVIIQRRRLIRRRLLFEEIQYLQRLYLKYILHLVHLLIFCSLEVVFLINQSQICVLFFRDLTLLFNIKQLKRELFTDFKVLLSVVKSVIKNLTILCTGLLIFRGKKSKISRDFQGQIHGKIGQFRGIFAGKKSKFAQKSADFA